MTLEEGYACYVVHIHELHIRFAEMVLEIQITQEFCGIHSAEGRGDTYSEVTATRLPFGSGATQRIDTP